MTEGDLRRPRRVMPTFASFLTSRGFDAKRTGPFLRRMFVDCWREPTFRGFWRLWNPLYGYALLRLYLMLGGHRRPLVASLVVFLTCGFFLHDLPMALWRGRPVVATTVTFAFYWAMLAMEPRGGDASSAGPARGASLRNLLRIVSGLAFGAVAERALLG